MRSASITPILHPLTAEINIPGSKSLTNRALLLATLSNGNTQLNNALFSDDSAYFGKALQTLGFEIDTDSEHKTIAIEGCNGKIPSAKSDLFIGNAGTAARFLSAFLTLGKGEYTIDGDERMRQRPIGDLISSLSQLGAHITPITTRFNKTGNPGYLPIKITADGLLGGRTSISGEVSSQYLSALLMVAPYASNPVEILVPTELNSKPYVEMTLAVMSDFGIEIEREGYQRFLINSGRYQSTGSYSIEPDASAASYFFAAGAILGGSVRIMNLTKKSRQGDIAFAKVLQKMGCALYYGRNYIEIAGPSSHRDFRGVDVDMSDIPDTAQTLAAIAPFASTATHIHGIASARVKESDRISATCTELARLGVKVEEYPDGMSIYPCDSIMPGSVKTYNDHRMAMSFSLIGLRIPGINIENPECVSKTFPEYFEVLEKLR